MENNQQSNLVTVAVTFDATSRDARVKALRKVKLAIASAKAKTTATPLDDVIVEFIRHAYGFEKTIGHGCGDDGIYVGGKKDVEDTSEVRY